MGTANSMAELKRMILTDMYKAMTSARQKSEEDTRTEVQSFYSQGSPRLYVRTGNLLSSIRARGANWNGDSVDFTIFLDQGINYLVPNPAFTERGFKSEFSTPQIFEAAETGTFGVKGRPGFWKRSVEKIKSDTDNALGRYFTKI